MQLFPQTARRAASMLSRPVWGHWVVLSSVALLGAFLRLYRIDYQSLWSDEAFSVAVGRLSLTEMSEPILKGSWNHPPLHYYLLHLWMQLFGVGSLQARLLSAVFGILSIPMIYVLARRLFDRQTGIVAAFLVAVSQLSVMYAQEARPYAQFCFLVLCSIYLFVIALREKRALAWWGFVCSAILMTYTNYYGLFVGASLLLYAVLYRKRYPLPRSWLVGGTALGLALSAPWLASGVIDEALHSKVISISGVQAPWFAVDKWTIFTTINAFNNGKASGLLGVAPRWSFVVGGLLFTVPALVALSTIFKRFPTGDQERSRRESLVLLAILWLLPLFLVIGLGYMNVQYDVRYVLFTAAPYYVLVAHGISELSWRGMRPVLVVLILAYSAFSLRANYQMPYKENYRDALAYLASEYDEADCAVFLPFGSVPDQWSIYDEGRPNLKVTSPDAVASGQTGCERVWVTTYRRVDWAIMKDEEGERTLETTHSKVEENRYFWVHVGLYVPKQP